jgi:hypothetical protein
MANIWENVTNNIQNWDWRPWMSKVRSWEVQMGPWGSKMRALDVVLGANGVPGGIKKHQKWDLGDLGPPRTSLWTSKVSKISFLMFFYPSRYPIGSQNDIQSSHFRPPRPHLDLPRPHFGHPRSPISILNVIGNIFSDVCHMLWDLLASFDPCVSIAPSKMYTVS